MDYDRWDALLHHIFKQTQGDAWFRPQEDALTSGVALRVAESPPEFRLFPYENLQLEPFEAAVKKLNPVVAVKVRSAAVHAALADVPPDATSIYVDVNTRIQILDTMLLLPHADKEQCAAFIRDERVLVIWSSSLDAIIPTCHDFEDRLIKLLWRSRPNPTSSLTASTTAGSIPGYNGLGIGGYSASNSVADHGSLIESNSASHNMLGSSGGHRTSGVSSGITAGDVPASGVSEKGAGKGGKKRTWYGKRLPPSSASGTEYTAPDLESLHPEKREAKLYAPLYNGLAAGLALVFMGNGVKTILLEFFLDGSYMRFVLFATLPLLYCVSLFFALQIIQNITMAIGPIAHYHSNSKYYSALPPRPNKALDNNLPHVTIQMPVYKESLDVVLTPSITSLKRAMQTYARQGGTSSIFINDDGLRLLNRADRDERIAFYATHGIAWTARPAHGSMGTASPDSPDLSALSEKQRKKHQKHQKADAPFERKGRFKKASNMNYGLALSLRVERHLEALLAQNPNNNTNANGISPDNSLQSHLAGGNLTDPLAPPHAAFAANVNRNSTQSTATQNTFQTLSHYPSVAGLSTVGGGEGQYGMQYMNKDGEDMDVGGIASNNGSGSQPTSPSGDPMSPTSGMPFNSTGFRDSMASNNVGLGYGSPYGGVGEEITLEERALSMAIEEAYEETGRRWKPWGANGKGMRVGEVLLIVDSDTIVPEDCLRDAAREMAECPTVAIIQHESDVMQVANHYFENGIAYFTRRINRCISIACANGEVAPFVGHNAFLRWKALQDAAFIDPDDGLEKIWSESNVSEDFDMALRLLKRGFIIRWATYSQGGFKEGVSLTVDDELNRWQKYAYGCNELLFNPLIEWWRKGPIAHQIHRFMWSSAPLHYKISMMAYMFSYYGIAGGATIAIINYVLLGFMLPVDAFYMHSFEIWLATTVVFFGSGNVGYTLLEYRLGQKQLIKGFIENLMWIPFFFFFFGGLSIPVSQAILAHLFSYNISWSATIKEVQRSNFFKEIPKIVKRFWFPLTVAVALIAGMIILSTSLVPLEWRVDGSAWAVIFPLAVVSACHILFPIVLNPWLMVFSY